MGANNTKKSGIKAEQYHNPDAANQLQMQQQLRAM